MTFTQDGIRIALVVLALVVGSSSEVQAEAPQGKVEFTSPLGRKLRAAPPGADMAKLEADLAKARAELTADPNNPDKIVWVGRRLGYLWRFHEAVDVYTDGIKQFPNYAPLYRHRGQRYISLRQFDRAVVDLRKAAKLMEGRVDEVEQDGPPNKVRAPLTTLKYNIYYYLGVAYYMQGDYSNAAIAFRAARPLVRVFDDNRIALTYWICSCLQRLGRTTSVQSELIDFGDGMNAIEHQAYNRLLMFYKGLMPEDKLMSYDAGPIDQADLMYGLGNWDLAHGKKAKAEALFKKIVDGPAWASLGYIAAEADLARDK